MTKTLVRRNRPEMFAPLFRDFERRMGKDWPEPFDLRFDEWFDRPLGEYRWVPAMDVVEEDNGFLVKVDLPGMTKKDIEITVEDNRLVVGGERKWEEKVDKDRLHRVERGYGKFHRMVALPGDVDPEKVTLETSFVDDLGADSLAVVELVLALEEAFEIDIPDEDTEKLRTFKDAVEYIGSKANS